MHLRFQKRVCGSTRGLWFERRVWRVLNEGLESLERGLGNGKGVWG